MTEKEFKRFLEQNKRKADAAIEDFEKHSKEIDKRIIKILAGL